MDDFGDEMLFDANAQEHLDPFVSLTNSTCNESSLPPSLLHTTNNELPGVNAPPNNSRDVVVTFESNSLLKRTRKKPIVAATDKSQLEHPLGKRDRPWLLARIEQVFERQLDSLFAGDTNLSITLRSRKQQIQVLPSPNHRSPQASTTHFRTFNFPGKSEQEAWRYTAVLRILELIHEALVSEVVITKRDIYYRDPALFSKQSVVDRYIDDLAYTFGVPRSLLNVTATAKGLVAGAFTITKSDCTVTNGMGERDGTLISRLSGDEIVDLSRVKWILIVEKEATFHSLLSSDFWDTHLPHGILVTAKGYPDISTRHLLSYISNPSPIRNTPNPPLFILVDYDPDGLSILSCYKYGSASMSHESLSLPSIRWLGVTSSHLGKHDSIHQIQGLLKLTKRDRRLAVRMLEREPFVEDGGEGEWRRETQVMLMLNIKAEIQVLEAGHRGLVGWLEGRGLFD